MSLGAQLPAAHDEINVVCFTHGAFLFLFRGDSPGLTSLVAHCHCFVNLA